MVSPFQHSVETAMQAQKNLAGELVTYHRAAVVSDPIQAVRGRTDVETVDEEGIVQRTELDDWLIEAADLVLSAQQVKPQRGDQIKYDDGSTTHVYTVVDDGAGSFYKHSDQHGKRLRIHTRKTGTE